MTATCQSNDSENSLTIKKSSTINEYSFICKLFYTSLAYKNTLNSITREYKNRSCWKFGSWFFFLSSFCCHVTHQSATICLFFVMLFIDVMIHGERNTWIDLIIVSIFFLPFFSRFELFICFHYFECECEMLPNPNDMSFLRIHWLIQSIPCWISTNWIV